VVPLRFHNEVLGIIATLNRTDGQPFSENDLYLMQALADQASASVHYAGIRSDLDAKKRIDRDLSAARAIQHALLPREIPRLGNAALAAFNEPAQAIGGDYYDVIPVDAGRWGIVIADVSGKGVAGAMLMSVCRSVLRAHAPGNASPAAVLREVNRILSADISEDLFITLLYMIYHEGTRELRIARAGHERPVVVSGGATQFLDSPGVAVALMPVEVFDRTLQEIAITLEPGACVAAYTDGITEALDPRGEEWGRENFLDVLVQTAPRGAAAVIESVRGNLARHSAGRPPNDDMTMVALRVDGA
jgi:sigma-B regulation protein RsbU (phosphoserine phosphatase)